MLGIGTGLTRYQPQRGAAVTPATGWGVVWHGTFESGNEDELTNINDTAPAENSGTYTLTYPDTQAHGGTYAAACTIDTSVDQAGVRLFRKKEAWSDAEPYYYGAWFYFPSVPTVGTFFNIWQFKSNDPVLDSEVAWKLEANNFDHGDGLQLGLRLVWDAPFDGPFSGDGDTHPQSWYQGELGIDTIPLPIAEWTHIEVYLKQSEAYDGRIIVWQDGVEIFDVDEIRTRNTDGNNNWSVNNYGNDITPNPWTIYIDDMLVSTRRIYPLEAMTETTYQPDGTDGVDTQIVSAATTTSYGSDTTISVGEMAGSTGIVRALLKPDLSGISSGAVIHKATLSLYLESRALASNSRTMYVFASKRAWTEAATWDTYDGTNAWQTAGGGGADDANLTFIGEVWVFNTMSVDQRVNIQLDCEVVQQWLDGELDNNGVLLVMFTENNDAYTFSSSDHATAAQRPLWSFVWDS